VSEHLTELKGEMTSLLSLLDGETGDPRALERAAAALQLKLQEAAGPSRTADLDREQRAELQTELEALLRLNAVAVSMVEHEVNSLTRGLEQVSDARRKLGASRPTDTAGGSVDVAG
jgi:hypothetical protein